ncbi:type IV pilin protein [Polaromonas sp. CG_9.11]|uniref:type IV pilin protein n=1 Tax=Polaromonas sp. CG_9.11 TaxID=2787730 RepID=UPI0018CB31C7|nr:type IV pilin protein [Polaromonas sp. CG_9.11]MBG6075500.1 type IV pilus assembly protein PilE [Polaromonas sp. CG_9.11]
MKTAHSQGFTLIELMIVVAIVAILASIAYPSYRSSILKGNRAQGRTALAELMQQQERYMTQRNCYLGFTTSTTFTATVTAPSPSTACVGVTALSVPFKTFSGESQSSAAYRMYTDTCPATGGTLSIAECVRVNAQPVGSDPDAGVLWMTSTGTKGCTGTVSTSNPALCWP